MQMKNMYQHFSHSHPTICIFSDMYVFHLYFLACNCVLKNTLYHNSSVCNGTTGQCLCKSYVGGRQCEHCAENYYNTTTHGCRRKYHLTKLLRRIDEEDLNHKYN